MVYTLLNSQNKNALSPFQVKCKGFYSLPNNLRYCRCFWHWLRKTFFFLQFSLFLLLFSLFLLLFMGPIAHFSTIHEFYCTISVTF